MRRFRVAALLAVAVGLVAAMAGCGSKPIAKINGKVITEEEFVKALQSGTANARRAASTLDGMVARELVLQAAKEKKITISESELGEARAQYQEMDMFHRVWKPLLGARLATEEDMVKEIEFVIYTAKLFITMDELKKFFEENREKFDRPAQVTIRRIGVKTKAEAEAIREKILAKEATFEEMAKEKSIEDDAAQGGRLGPLPEGAFESVNPELEEAVFKTLKLKEISQPIKVEITKPRQPGEEEEEEDEEEPETRWTLVEVLTRPQRIPATWEKSWFAVMQQAIYQPQYYEKISQEIAKLKGAATIEVFPPKYRSLNEQYASLKRSQPLRFGAPGKAEPAKAEPAVPGTTVPPTKAAPPMAIPPTERPAKAAPPKAVPPAEAAAKPAMQPLRRSLEELGATVDWSQAGRVATAQLGRRTVRVKVGATSAVIDGRQVKLAAPVELRRDRVWVTQEFLTAVRNAASGS